MLCKWVVQSHRADQRSKCRSRGRKLDNMLLTIVQHPLVLRDYCYSCKIRQPQPHWRRPWLASQDTKPARCVACPAEASRRIRCIERRCRCRWESRYDSTTRRWCRDPGGVVAQRTVKGKSIRAAAQLSGVSSAAHITTACDWDGRVGEGIGAVAFLGTKSVVTG